MRALTALLLFCCATSAAGQSGGNSSSKVKVTSSVDGVSAVALSKSAIAAHGGEKLIKMQTLVIRGSVDVTTSAMAQAIPASFYTVISGERYALEIQNPFQPLKQTFDGNETYSSIRGFSLPPITKLGFPLLPRAGDAGYTVSDLPNLQKKRRGFRITAPDDYYTDFFVDEKTGMIKGYESSYEVNGRIVTTSVEIDKYRIVNGISIPERYAQRFELGTLTAYADFKAKEILVDVPIEPGVFRNGN